MACTHRMGRKCCPEWTTTGGFQSQHWHWTRLTRVCFALRDTAWILIYSYFKRNSAFSETVYLTENFVTTPCPNVEAEAVRQPIEDVLRRVSLKLDSFFTNQKKCFLSERAVTVQIFFSPSETTSRKIFVSELVLDFLLLRKILLGYYQERANDCCFLACFCFVVSLSKSQYLLHKQMSGIFWDCLKNH